MSEKLVTPVWLVLCGRALDYRFAWSLCTAGAIVLIYGSLEPRLAPPGVFALDKIAHLAAYGGLTLLGCLPCDRLRRCVPIALGLIVLGGLIEVAQSFVPGRDASIGDGVANACGVMLGLAVSRAMRAKVLAQTAWRPVP